MRPVLAPLARVSVLIALLLGAPGIAGAQTSGPGSGAGSGAGAGTGSAAGTGSGSETGTATGASGSGAATRTETVSETGTGSTATITRGDHAPRGTAPRARGDGEELPVNEQDDGRRADFIWIEVEGGVSWVNLVAFQQTNFSGVTVGGFDEVEGVGPMLGGALGFRVFFFALGARATIASYPGFEIGTVGGEAQFRIPTPVVEPYIRVGAGYAWQGSANYRDPMMSSTNVYGWTLNGAIGLDIFIAWWFTLGVGASVDFLNMTRQTDVRMPCMGVTDFCPTENGDAIGAQARGYAQAGFHF